MIDVVEFLKDYIWENGFEILSVNPFDVYEAMEDHGIEARIARFVLVTLMSETHVMARSGSSESELVEHIQQEHSLNKKIARLLASMYLELFSEENQKSWDDADEAGFEEFCEQEWTVECSGSCDWHTKHGGSYPCSAEASLTFSVLDKDELHKHLSAQLKANPFLTTDEILLILEEEINADLDNDFEEYCDADDYYQPVFEDFVSEGTYESEDKWKSWGLEILEFTGSGDIDFEPW